MNYIQKAWFYKEHGTTEVLQYGVPQLGDNQVLVRVRAAALNPVDLRLRNGEIKDTSLDFPVVPGCDVAGVIVDEGDNVSKFSKGDEVYGNIQNFNTGRPKQCGTLTQYTAVEESLIALKPENRSFEEAASFRLALQTAQEGFDRVNFQRDQTVFVVGGEGGVGSLAIQLAKYVYGASKIATTTSSGNVEFLRQLGADTVIDYRKQSYDQTPQKFDFVFDTIGSRIERDSKRVWTLAGSTRMKDPQVVPGCDVAGVIVDEGDNVSKFSKGDEIYGNIQNFNTGRLKQCGTLTQYTAVEESLIALKPENMSFEEAASFPLALQTAQEGFDRVNFQRGQTVFVVGGAGGFGSLAIQLAKYVYGASKIATTTSTGNVDFLRQLGADTVIDYRKQSYDQIPQKFDFVFDTIGDSHRSYVVAKESAKIIDIANPSPHPSAESYVVTASGCNLERLRGYIECEKLKPVIDPICPYAFSNVREAFKHLESGRANGKIVISPID